MQMLIYVRCLHCLQVDKIVDDDWTVRPCRALSATDVLSIGVLGMESSMGREVRFS